MELKIKPPKSDTYIINIMKTLCLFAFHEINERVLNFIKYAVFNDSDVDFIFIANNTHITRDELNLPEYCTFLSRENIGFDFGGWSYGLLYNNLYVGYDYFIFVNSTVSGPYLPSYYNNSHE
jgi:lipopolysaccharide biosynthesis protein